jgi:hypothetical protein
MAAIGNDAVNKIIESVGLGIMRDELVELRESIESD